MIIRKDKSVEVRVFASLRKLCPPVNILRFPIEAKVSDIFSVIGIP